MTSSRIFSPAMAGSAALHLLVALALLISWPWAKEIRIGAAVPVTIVANAPTTNLRPAVKAPEVQEAQTEVPAPDAPVETVTPQPETTPAPPTAKTAPAAVAKAEQTSPVAKKPPSKKASSDLDFDSLLASISKSGKSAGAERANAKKGASQAETATEARPDLGSGLSASALNGLADELQRRWNPNCEVEGAQNVMIRATFTLGSTGQVIGDVKLDVRSGADPAVARAAADRARRAVYAAAPFRSLPRELYGQKIAVNFNAREACS
ncbi:energy transducer TonB [Phenylobacterium sp.]|uniref:energy transducer TonB n=1 Tax=Phenylobacterium sp. TaxID=1871053 RepID=UPI0035B4D6F1